MTSGSRQRLLQLVADQAKSTSPERARALEDLHASIAERPPFFLDVMRPELLGSPEVELLLEGYGVDSDTADPERFLQALETALRDTRPYGRYPRNHGPRTLADGLIAGLESVGRRLARWRRG